MYKLCCKDKNIKEVYIGSTTNIIKRRSEHKANCKNEKRKEHNNKKYKFIRENGGWENWSMIMIEKYPCDNGEERRMREEQIRLEHHNNLNIRRAYQTEEDRIEDNREYMREYYHTNKDKLNEERKKKVTCECGSVVRMSDIVRHRKSKKHISLIKDNNTL